MEKLLKCKTLLKYNDSKKADSKILKQIKKNSLLKEIVTKRWKYLWLTVKKNCASN